jgi:hypothetical protein
MPIMSKSAPSPAASTTASQGLAVDSILSRLVRECGDRPPDGVLALKWLEDRYRQVWNAMDWEFASSSAVLQTVATISSGTVTLTNGSATISETTTNANGWTSAVEGRYFRATGDDAFYPISTFTDGTPDTITLSRNYEGDSSSDQGYMIFQNVYSLTTDVGKIQWFVDLKTGNEIEPVSQIWLDEGFPNRAGNSTQMQYWAPAGRDSDDIQQVELYPIPTEVHGIQYRYIQEAPFLIHGGSTIVPQVPESLLKHGWKADYFSWRSGMDDSTGAEINWAQREELLFMKELNEMAVKEASNQPLQKIRMARRYVRHRFLRNYPYRVSHFENQLP